MTESAIPKVIPGTYDHCLNQFSTKSLIGMGLGFTAAFLLSAKRGVWLSGMVYGAGVGGGMSFLQCREVLDRLYSKATLEDLEADNKSS